MKINLYLRHFIRLSAEKKEEVEIVEVMKNADCLNIVRRNDTKTGDLILEPKIAFLCRKPFQNRGRNAHGTDGDTVRKTAGGSGED